MEWVTKNWLMEMNIQDSLIMAVFMGMECINGKMEVFMRDNFSEEKGKAKEAGKEPMEILLKDSTTMT